ncbi:hypothetical protein SALWKB12_1324 [Snodgrassella communis]|nr:hypothetical protein SALWKB12_1324 [Snodgrassella communis]
MILRGDAAGNTVDLVMGYNYCFLGYKNIFFLNCPNRLLYCWCL